VNRIFRTVAVIALVCAALLSPITPAAAATKWTQKTVAVGPDVPHLLPDGESGKVAVIGHGLMYDDGFMMVLVQNGTKKTVSDVTVRAQVIDIHNDLVGVATTGLYGPFAPTVLAPGDVGIGIVKADGNLGDISHFKFEVKYHSGDSTSGYINLQLSKVRLVNDHLVGTVKNPSKRSITQADAVVVCASSGGIENGQSGGVVLDLESGGSTVFSFGGGLQDLSNCPQFMIALIGRPY
jgi:hypothetical protein